MAFLRNIDELRSVEWSASYLWDIRFTDPTPPAPFNNFFPAQDVQENLTNLESYQQELMHKAVKVPHRSSPRSIAITFADDIDNTLLNWLHEWMEGEIFNDDGSKVKVLDEICRRIDILKLDESRNTLQTTSYWVYPEGPLNFNGTSQAQPHQYNFTFVVAGRVGKRPKSQNTDFTAQRIPETPNTIARLTDEELETYGFIIDSPNGRLGVG